MKKTAILLLGVFLTLSSITVAQNKSKTPTRKKTTTSSNSLANANKVIAYANSVNEFFRGYYKTSHVGSYYSNVKIALAERGKKVRNTVSDTYRGMPEFDNALKAFNARVSAESPYVTLPEPPASAGISTAKVSEINMLWTAFQAAYKECFDQRDAVKQYLDSDLDLINKRDLPKLEAELEVYKEKAIIFYRKETELRNSIDELADSAEEVTLGNHPYKNEIIDFKKTLRLAKTINNAVQQVEDEKELKEILPVVEVENTQLKDYISKYENYNTNVQGIKQQKMKGLSKEYFCEKLAHFTKTVDQLNDLGTKKLDRAKSDVYKALDYMNLTFGSFVETNNRD